MVLVFNKDGSFNCAVKLYLSKDGKAAIFSILDDSTKGTQFSESKFNSLLRGAGNSFFVNNGIFDFSGDSDDVAKNLNAKRYSRASVESQPEEVNKISRIGSDGKDVVCEFLDEHLKGFVNDGRYYKGKYWGYTPSSDSIRLLNLNFNFNTNPEEEFSFSSLNNVKKDFDKYTKSLQKSIQKSIDEMTKELDQLVMVLEGARRYLKQNGYNVGGLGY